MKLKETKTKVLDFLTEHKDHPGMVPLRITWTAADTAGTVLRKITWTPVTGKSTEITVALIKVLVAHQVSKLLGESIPLVPEIPTSEDLEAAKETIAVAWEHRALVLEKIGEFIAEAFTLQLSFKEYAYVLTETAFFSNSVSILSNTGKASKRASNYMREQIGKD